jgi:hypothetical protein
MKRSSVSRWLVSLRRSLGPPPPPPRRYFSARCWPAARGLAGSGPGNVYRNRNGRAAARAARQRAA